MPHCHTAVDPMSLPDMLVSSKYYYQTSQQMLEGATHFVVQICRWISCARISFFVRYACTYLHIWQTKCVRISLLLRYASLSDMKPIRYARAYLCASDILLHIIYFLKQPLHCLVKGEDSLRPPNDRSLWGFGFLQKWQSSLSPLLSGLPPLQVSTNWQVASSCSTCVTGGPWDLRTCH